MSLMAAPDGMVASSTACKRNILGPKLSLIVRVKPASLVLMRISHLEPLFYML